MSRSSTVFHVIKLLCIMQMFVNWFMLCRCRVDPIRWSNWIMDYLFMQFSGVLDQLLHYLSPKKRGTIKHSIRPSPTRRIEGKKFAFQVVAKFGKLPILFGSKVRFCISWGSKFLATSIIVHVFINVHSLDEACPTTTPIPNSCQSSDSPTEQSYIFFAHFIIFKFILSSCSHLGIIRHRPIILSGVYSPHASGSHPSIYLYIPYE